MLIFPDSSVETEYTDPNGVDWIFDGTGWVKQCDCSGGDGGGSSEGAILQLDGEEAGSDFTDRTGQTTVNGVGGAQNTTSDFKYGSGCISLRNGAGLEVSGQAMSVIAAGSFTFEAWIKINGFGTGGNTNRYPIFSQMSAGGNSFYFNLTKSGSSFSKINFTHVAGYSNATGEHDLAENPMDGDWHHFACCWDAENNKSYVFYDGVLKGTAQASRGLDITGGKIMINRSAYTAVDDQFGDGWYDDIRVSNFVRYTGDFTPPGELGTSRQALVRDYVEDSNDVDLP